MKLFLPVLVLAAATVARGSALYDGGPIPMTFSNTDVAQALKAVSLRTGASVVYAASKDKLTVSLNATVESPEQAVRCVASAAGLVVRKVGNLYMVASTGNMRQALEPYGVKASLSPRCDNIEAFCAKLQDLLPYATLRVSGDKIAMFGVPEDILAAREAAEDLSRRADAMQPATDVVVLHRVAASKIAPLVTGIFPELKVTTAGGDGAGGAIGLAGPAPRVQAARATLEKLDSESDSSETVYKVYQLKYASAKAITEFLKKATPTVEATAGPEAYQPKRASFNPLSASMSGSSGFFGGGGSDSGSGGGTTSSGGSGSGVGSASVSDSDNDHSKTVVLRGLQSDVDNAIKMLAEVDRKPKQVVVEVNVIETSPENTDATGVLYNWAPFDFIESPRGTSFTKNPGGDAIDNPITKAAGLGQFSRVPWNFRGILNALVTKREAKILAKPTVQVIDNGQASVFVGDTLRSRIVTGGALGAQNIEIREFPVGIILLIAPRVNADGNITLHVNPVVSTVSSVDANNVPQTSAREAETTAIVKSGETVVLGGLIRDEDIKTVQEVPLLSKLPIVGQLFRNRTRNHRRNDIIVSITPHLIDDESTTASTPATPAANGGAKQ